MIEIYWNPVAHLGPIPINFLFIRGDVPIVGLGLKNGRGLR